MGSPFHNVEDKKMKLAGTVCMWQGMPHLVTTEPPGTMVTCHRLGDGTSLSVDYTDPEFNYKSVPLGYIDYGKACYYLSRVPHRQNKAGIAVETLAVVPRGEVYPDHMINTKAMENCILGVYTTYERACQEVEDGKSHSRAFSRRMCVSKEGRHIAVHYRGRVIGHKGRGSPDVRLLPSGDQSYMSMILRKAGIPCL